jgi:hypothetical protein
MQRASLGLDICDDFCIKLYELAYELINYRFMTILHDCGMMKLDCILLRNLKELPQS